jgi:hypothetical protein
LRNVQTEDGEIYDGTTLKRDRFLRKGSGWNWLKVVSDGGL